MKHSSEETKTLDTLSSQMADAVEQFGQALVLVDGRRRLAASGVVFAPGMVVTADHVLEREEDLSVVHGDGRRLSAQFVGRDPATDLAVLRVADLGSSPAAVAAEMARVGQIVMAVGRPSSEGPMASIGIVSAVGGPVRTRRGAMLERYIQTDATLYPGFSGGALINARGEVLGIATSGLAGGLALAVPVSIAWSVAETLARQGHIKRGYLGISSQPVRLNEAQRAGRPQESGLLIVHVEQGSPAEQSGLLLGDILVALDGRPITDTDELQALLTGERAGTTVPAEVIRGGALHLLDVSVGTRGWGPGAGG